MKRGTVIRLAIGLFAATFLFCFALTARQAEAQVGGYPENPEAYSREELAQMLAPVALYPDVLLSQILMASTYPVEVIEADRWVRRNPHLRDDALDRALLAKDWDPSVKAVCHFPSILALMSERIAETTEIGNAFLAQEPDVMDMVQELRVRAYARGNLVTDARQKVVVERQTIIIEPASPRVVYVPYYDPFTVYGPWWYSAYPPWIWGPPGTRIGVGISYWPGFHFSFVWSSWSYFDWPRRTICIDVHKRPRYVRHERWVIVKPGPWHHSPVHRRGVVYRDRSIALKYGQPPSRFRDYGRDTRGFSGRREMERNHDRRGGERTGIERVGRGDDRPRVQPERQKAQRMERERQKREQPVPDRQKRQTVKKEREIPGRGGREQTKSGHPRQERKVGAGERQVKEPVGRDPGKQHKIGNAKKERDDRPDRQESAKAGKQRGKEGKEKTF